jgi:hypothetical protein
MTAANLRFSPFLGARASSPAVPGVPPGTSSKIPCRNK